MSPIQGKDHPPSPDREVVRTLMGVPGVGKKTAADLIVLDIRSVADLVDRDPERLYDALCEHAGMKVDRCMLYVFRCAVYFASTKEPNPALLKWWNWKDGHALPFSGQRRIER